MQSWNSSVPETWGRGSANYAVQLFKPRRRNPIWAVALSCEQWRWDSCYWAPKSHLKSPLRSRWRPVNGSRRWINWSLRPRTQWPDLPQGTSLARTAHGLVLAECRLLFRATLLCGWWHARSDWLVLVSLVEGERGSSSGRTPFLASWLLSTHTHTHTHTHTYTPTHTHTLPLQLATTASYMYWSLTPPS